MTQADRSKARILCLLEVLEQLTDEDNRLSKSAIIKEMKKKGVSIGKKALTDSLEILEDIGYNIDCQLDEKEGNTYCLLSRDFELHEVNILIDAVQSSRFISAEKSEALIKKLQKLISKHQAERIRKRMFFEGRVKAQNENVFYNINEIIRALDEGLWVEFDYLKYDATKKLENKRERHLAFPFAMVWEEDCYYMIGTLFNMPGDKLTHFRIDRMKQVASIDDVSSHVDPKAWRNYDKYQLNILMKYREDFNIDDYMKKTFKMFTGVPCRIVLRFHESILNNMIDRFGRDSNIRQDGVNYFKLHTDIHLSYGFYYWLLSYADMIELLEPNSAREVLRRIINNTLEPY